VAQFFVDVIVCMAAGYLADGDSESWLRNGLVQVPITVFTEENKLTLLGTLTDKRGFRKSAIAYELDVLAKRARGSAVRQK